MEIENRKTTLYLDEKECLLIKLCIEVALLNKNFFSEKDLEKLKWLRINL